MRRFLLLLLLSGCYSISSMPIGAALPPRPRCRIHFEALTPAEADQRYRQVGAVCVATSDFENGEAASRLPDSWGTDLRDDFHVRACQLGGDIAIPVGFCAVRGGRNAAPGTQFAIYRER
jgi:hypothetical protein